MGTSGQVGEGDTDCDLSPVEIGDRSVGVAYGHEEQTLPGHQGPIVEAWPAEPESVAELVPVQPAAVGFEHGSGRVLWRLGFQGADDVGGEGLGCFARVDLVHEETLHDGAGLFGGLEVVRRCSGEVADVAEEGDVIHDLLLP